MYDTQNSAPIALHIKEMSKYSTMYRVPFLCHLWNRYCGSIVIQSTVLHKCTGHLCFAMKIFGIAQVVGLYYKSLVSTDLPERNCKTKTYRASMTDMLKELSEGGNMACGPGESS